MHALVKKPLRMRDLCSKSLTRTASSVWPGSTPLAKAYRLSAATYHADTKVADDLLNVQHGPKLNRDFEDALRLVLWQFPIPIRYAFAYGSGVFPQSAAGQRYRSITDAELHAVHPQPPVCVRQTQGGAPKMIDLIFGINLTQHWHSLNLKKHPDHYSALRFLGSGAISAVQDRWGAGVYFNPYVVVKGILIKYGVVNIDTLCTDLTEWSALYLAGRLHKPVMILRDDARVRLASQTNLLSALRTALLLLPPKFTERDLYTTLSGVSYLGDPRMSLRTENPNKVANIVACNLPHFRRLYGPLIERLPNVAFADSTALGPDWVTDSEFNRPLTQDWDPIKRGNMVRRLPKSFRDRLYFLYQRKFGIPQFEFDKIMAATRPSMIGAVDPCSEGGSFDRRIAEDQPESLRAQIRAAIKQTVAWSSTTQSLKGFLTAGVARSVRYLGEKFSKYRQGTRESV